MNHADDSGQEDGIIPTLIEEDSDDEDEDEARPGQLKKGPETTEDLQASVVIVLQVYLMV